MTVFYRILYIAIFSTFILATVQGQNLILKQSNESGIYNKGQRVQVRLFLNDHRTDSVVIKIRRNYNDQVSNRMFHFTGDTLLVFDEIVSGPSSVIFEASTKSETASIGLVVDPEKFKPGTRRPADFEKYWKTEIKGQRALTLKAKTFGVAVGEKGFKCTDVEINSASPKPVRGYLAKPESARPKSLPIVLYVRAAGVKGAWCRSEPENALRYAKMGNGALCFDMNAHGMLNRQSEAYYVDLENGELKDYFYHGMESRSEFYFGGMYLRLLRALDYLTSLPEWDGRRILVIGESQGGGQALAAAGLDKRVTAVVATVPAMCDWGGALSGFRGGWPQPFEKGGDREKQLSTLPYFDNAHLLKGSKATILVEIGLIDNTCPSTSIYAAINQARGKKIILAVPYRPHQAPSNYLTEIWNTTVYKQKEDFITDYLK